MPRQFYNKSINYHIWYDYGIVLYNFYIQNASDPDWFFNVGDKYIGPDPTLVGWAVSDSTITSNNKDYKFRVFSNSILCAICL